MSKQHFLACTQQTIVPPSRWLHAFPDGQWSNWNTLLAIVRGGDTVWVPVLHADWLGKVDALARHEAAIRVAVVSNAPNDAEGLLALNAGARGYCHAWAVPDMLREVAQVIGHGGLWVGPELVQRLMAATREVLARATQTVALPVDVSCLSEREAQVAWAVASGKSNKEVAEQLHIAERTVKAHLGAVFDKLGVRDRVQLVLRLQQAAPPLSSQ